MRRLTASNKSEFDLFHLIDRLKKSATTLVSQIDAVAWGRTDAADSKFAAEKSGDKRVRFVELDGPKEKRAGASPDRIVIFRLGSLGDTVVALPCFHKLAQVFPDAERIVLTNNPVSSKAAPLEAVLDGSGLIDGVIAYPVNMRSIAQLWRLRSQLLALNASTLVFLQPRGLWSTCRDQIFFRMCGFQRIIGGPLRFDTRKGIFDETTGEREYECERLARSIAEVGEIDLKDSANWDLRLAEHELAVGAETILAFEDRPFVGINMGGKVAGKHWGDDNWSALFANLATTHGGYGLLIVGVAEDAACVDAVTQSWPGRVVNACGRLAPRESAAALSRASLFVGHDSGPMHLAAACGVTCVAPFGGNNLPHTWHPYGSRHRIVHNVEGVRAITVGEIAGKVRECLPASKPIQIKS
ncbi:glycosyltransferase family 9 protein [Methylocapsa palsarum]|uniref:ADP-heptose:LPS heptosyltransferase n=1 Tax=Methylocapsa palsarum TaxID=1612308 RepID=A0A1I4B3R3_9HYPH|nr:glycosyltransferase family 9 protein [Methylocapsa palsarum]SFK62539.1 ADP-heptose:LPS heptosyltransferase [Methylocapsa palsarum]